MTQALSQLLVPEGPMADEPPASSDLEADAPREYTIDELAAATGISTRTIRFYQSKGALHKPEIRGRKAFYVDSHVERLGLVGQLMDRGLRIRAIRDLVARFDRGELVLSEWLGLQDSLSAPWLDEGSVLLDEAALKQITGKLPPGKLAELIRLGLLEATPGGKLLCANSSLLKVVLDLDSQGVSLYVTANAIKRIRKHTGKLSKELAQLFESHVGEGFGGDHPTQLREALDAWRARGPGLVSEIFSEQMQQVLTDRIVRGKGGKLQG